MWMPGHLFLCSQCSLQSKAKGGVQQLMEGLVRMLCYLFWPRSVVCCDLTSLLEPRDWHEITALILGGSSTVKK